MPSKRKYTEEEKSEVLAELESSKSIEDVSRNYSVHVQLIKNN